MYKTAYVCDCCGKEMQIPGYTLELRTNSLCVQDRISWHYCKDCWEDIKKALTKENEPNILKKTIEDLKEENEKLKREASWYQEFWLAMFKAAEKNREKYTNISPYVPNTDSLFTTGCCCESADKKEDLDYKQSVGMI